MFGNSKDKRELNFKLFERKGVRAKLLTFYPQLSFVDLEK